MQTKTAQTAIIPKIVPKIMPFSVLIKEIMTGECIWQKVLIREIGATVAIASRKNRMFNIFE